MQPFPPRSKSDLRSVCMGKSGDSSKNKGSFESPLCLYLEAMWKVPGTVPNHAVTDTGLQGSRIEPSSSRVRWSCLQRNGSRQSFTEARTSQSDYITTVPGVARGDRSRRFTQIRELSYGHAGAPGLQLHRPPAGDWPFQSLDKALVLEFPGLCSWQRP